MNGLAREDHVRWLLRLADTSLVLGQRLGEWVGHAPAIEEDLGLANTALDLIGQARLLLSYAGELEGRGRDEDALAFLRAEHEFLNVALAEQPNGDFGVTIVRQFLLDAWQCELYERLQRSSDARLAEIAAKALKETLYHVRYSGGWLVRLGDGTDESHARAQEAIDHLWAYTGEMFAVDDSERGLIDAGIAIDPASLKSQWLKIVSGVVAEATLTLPSNDWMQQGGRIGHHSEHLGHLLSELQSLQRTFPGAAW